MKIVEGCKAVTISDYAPNNGIEVTVGKFIGKPASDVYDFVGNDYWEIDGLIEFTSGAFYKLSSESKLKRIDDHPKMGSWESLQDIFIPDRSVVY